MRTIYTERRRQRSANTSTFSSVRRNWSTRTKMGVVTRISQPYVHTYECTIFFWVSPRSPPNNHLISTSLTTHGEFSQVFRPQNEIAELFPRCGGRQVVIFTTLVYICSRANSGCARLRSVRNQKKLVNHFSALFFLSAAKTRNCPSAGFRNWKIMTRLLSTKVRSFFSPLSDDGWMRRIRGTDWQYYVINVAEIMYADSRWYDANLKTR